MADLRNRVRQLERKRAHRDRFVGVNEVWFTLYSDELPADTVVPEGSKVVEDFHEQFVAEDWGGRPGVTFRSGYYSERVTSDPDDQGRVVPASENPI